MKNKILEIYASSPKRYIAIIKQDPELLEWVSNNTKIVSDSLKDHLWHVISGESNVCKFGKIKKVERFPEGFKNCGAAFRCHCTKEALSAAVSNTKQQISVEEQRLINEKRAQTMIGRYGVKFNSQRPDLKHVWQKPKIDPEILAKLDNEQWLNEQYNVNQRTLVDIADELGVYYSTVGEYCKKFNFTIRQTSNYSSYETEVSEFIESLGFNTIKNDRSRIGKELDILIPDANLAIEINGLYWHSYHPKSGKEERPHRHLEKYQLAAAQNLQLLQITDEEWSTKTEIIKSMIRSKLGVTNKIYARQCKVHRVEADEARQFIEENHLLGSLPMAVSVGLYYDGELVSLMSYKKSRFSKTPSCELLRYCTKNNFTVVGGGSKLLNEIVKEFETVVAQVDVSKFSGQSLVAMGFKETKHLVPEYFWTDGTTSIPKYICRKNHIKEWLPSYNPALNDADNMFAANYRRYYDCGTKFFVYQ